MIILNGNVMFSCGNADVSVPNAFTKRLPGFTPFVRGEKLVAGEMAHHLGPREPNSYQMTVGSEVLSERTVCAQRPPAGWSHSNISHACSPPPHLPERGSHSMHSAGSGALRSAQVSSLSTPGHVSGVIPVYPMLSCPHCLSLGFLLVNTYNPGFLSLTVLGSGNTGLPGSGLGFTLLSRLVHGSP